MRSTTKSFHRPRNSETIHCAAFFVDCALILVDWRRSLTAVNFSHTRFRFHSVSE